mmetsp:Transcript_24686/g.57340  ORF Transcript_24686/g.57340 Transcript_24686/m.57340 type:complete len:251 (+) Transcript_24686:1130-1882(+)
MEGTLTLTSQGCWHVRLRNEKVCIFPSLAAPPTDVKPYGQAEHDEEEEQDDPQHAGSRLVEPVSLHKLLEALFAEQISLGAQECAKKATNNGAEERKVRRRTDQGRVCPLHHRDTLLGPISNGCIPKSTLCELGHLVQCERENDGLFQVAKGQGAAVSRKDVDIQGRLHHCANVLFFRTATAAIAVSAISSTIISSVRASSQGADNVCQGRDDYNDTTATIIAWVTASWQICERFWRHGHRYILTCVQYN